MITVDKFINSILEIEKVKSSDLSIIYSRCGLDISEEEATELFVAYIVSFDFCA